MQPPKLFAGEQRIAGGRKNNLVLTATVVQEMMARGTNAQQVGDVVLVKRPDERIVRVGVPLVLQMVRLGRIVLPTQFAEASGQFLRIVPGRFQRQNVLRPLRRRVVFAP